MAMCGKCKRSERGRYHVCHAGHKVKFPLLANDHDCPDYEYDTEGEKVCKTPFNQVEFEYCAECGFNYNGVCDGKSWIPFKSNPCEFFRHMELTCKHAIPILQYGNEGIRNNHCALPPEQRKTAARQHKDWCCPNAHRHTSMECYESREAS